MTEATRIRAEREEIIRTQFRGLEGAMSGREIAREYGIPQSVVSTISRLLMEETETSYAPLEIDGMGPDDALPNGDDVVGAWKRRQKESEEVSKARYSQVIKIPGPGPAAIWWSSDWHCGAEFCDVIRLEKDIETVSKTDGMYAALGGDYHENAIGRMAFTGSNTPTTVMQEIVGIDHYFGLLGKKIIMLVGGNHDQGRMMKEVGLDHIALLLKSSRCLYDRDEILVNLKLGKATWLTQLRHKWKGYSKYNPTHGFDNADKFGEFPFDLAIGGHTHNGTEIVQRWNRLRRQYWHGIQLGTYKTLDDYAIREGFARPPEVGTAVTIHYPDGRIFATHDMEMAVDLLKFARSRS